MYVIGRHTTVLGLNFILIQSPIGRYFVCKGPRTIKHTTGSWDCIMVDHPFCDSCHKSESPPICRVRVPQVKVNSINQTSVGRPVDIT